MTFDYLKTCNIFAYYVRLQIISDAHIQITISSRMFIND